MSLQDDIEPIRSSSKTFFICWEGQKNEGFSFSQRMSFVRANNETLIPGPNMRWMINILPERMSRAKHPRKIKTRSDSYASDGLPSIPTDHSYVSTQTIYSVSLKSRKVVNDDIPDDDDELRSAVGILTIDEHDTPEKRGHTLLSSVDSWKSLDGPSSQEWVSQGMRVCQLLMRLWVISTEKNNKYELPCNCFF